MFAPLVACWVQVVVGRGGAASTGAASRAIASGVASAGEAPSTGEAVSVLASTEVAASVPESEGIPASVVSVDGSSPTHAATAKEVARAAAARRA
jgi:hypothetical protein